MIWAHNLCHLSLSATRVTVQWLTNQSFLVVMAEVTMCSYYTWAKFYRVCIYHCQMIGCFNHQMVTLFVGDSGYEKIILVLEFNCISNLIPNHTLQLTTLKTSVSESLQLHFKMILWWLSHRCSVVTISFYVVAHFRYTKDYVTLTIHTRAWSKGTMHNKLKLHN